MGRGEDIVCKLLKGRTGKAWRIYGIASRIQIFVTVTVFDTQVKWIEAWNHMALLLSKFRNGAAWQFATQKYQGKPSWAY